jgi:hypothetical protein
MSNHRDSEMAEIVVVLHKNYENRMAEAVVLLKSINVDVSSTDEENNVVEGTVESGRLMEVHKLDCVDYVRLVMTYIADYPTGDPRDQDGIEDDEQ